MAGQPQTLSQAWAWCIVGSPVHAPTAPSWCSEQSLGAGAQVDRAPAYEGLQVGLWVEGQAGSLWRKDLEGEVPVGSRLRVQPHPQDRAGRRASCP